MPSRNPPPRLGRGLAALLGDSGAPSPDNLTVRMISADLLEPNPFQPRKRLDAEALDELTESVRLRGVLQPILARPHPGRDGRFQIVAGERRWRAAQGAGLHEIPSLVRGLTDAEMMAAALVENLQRQDLNAIEEGEGYRKLLTDFDLTQESVALTVGKSRSHVANTLRLLNLPETVQGEVRNGALSAGHGRALLALPDPQAAARNVIARGLNVRQTEALAAPKSPSSKHRDGPEVQATRALERDLSERLGLDVRITSHGEAGVLQIRYRSLDQLDSVSELLKTDRH